MADEKRIYVASAESILLPTLALYSGVARADRLEACFTMNSQVYRITTHLDSLPKSFSPAYSRDQSQRAAS